MKVIGNRFRIRYELDGKKHTLVVIATADQLKATIELLRRSGTKNITVE